MRPIHQPQIFEMDTKPDLLRDRVNGGSFSFNTELYFTYLNCMIASRFYLRGKEACCSQFCVPHAQLQYVKVSRNVSGLLSFRLGPWRFTLIAGRTCINPTRARPPTLNLTSLLIPSEVSNWGPEASQIGSQRGQGNAGKRCVLDCTVLYCCSMY